MGAISIKIDDTYPSTSGRIRKFVAQIGRFALKTFNSPTNTAIINESEFIYPFNSLGGNDE